MLMKLTPGLDFINVLRTAFTPVAPQSVRTQSSCQYLFTLSGSTSVKAVRRTLMKLSPGRKMFVKLTEEDNVEVWEVSECLLKEKIVRHLL